MKPALLAAVIVGGFAIGAGLSTLWRGEARAPDATESVLAMFKRACLPGAPGESAPTEAALGLVSRETTTGGQVWVDPASGVLVRMKPEACSLHLLDQSLLDRIDMDRLAQMTAAMIAVDLPDLQREPSRDMGWPFHETWAAGDKGTNKGRGRWWLTLAKTRYNDGPPALLMSVQYPPAG